MLLVTSSDLMRLYSLVCNTTISTSGVAENTRLILRSPGTAAVYRSESSASKWLAGFSNEFFGHGKITLEEARIDRPLKVSSWERILGWRKMR